MNNVSELYSLIHFLRIRPYCEPENFRRDFTTPLKSSSDSAKSRAMRKLQALLKAILLRRTKKSQIDGKSILDLPERTTEQSHAIFSDDELAFYKALETHTQLTFNKYLRANTVGRNYSNILVLLLRLRQAVSLFSELFLPFILFFEFRNMFRVATQVFLLHNQVSILWKPSKEKMLILQWSSVVILTS